MSKQDEAVEEIRAVRRAISERFGHDTKALLDHYREMEKQYEGRMLRRALPAGPASKPEEQDRRLSD